MTLFFNYEQAADLLGTDVDGVKELIRQGELNKTPDGIPADEVALYLLEKDSEPANSEPANSEPANSEPANSEPTNGERT